MSSASTEATLRDWRYGNAQAERLCRAAAFRVLRGCRPTTSIGGTRRPERCSLQPQRESVDRGRIFPPTPPSFKDIQAKFEHDFAGVAANGADGFAFFANQPAIGERELLQAKAGAAPLEIYHLERMRFYWIRPKGAGFGSNICGFQ
jgi:hypothetical protein